MKINSLSIISVVSVLTCATAADASVLAEFYLGGMVGAGGQTMFTKDKHDNSAASLVGAIAGVDIPILRLEAEYNYFNSSELDTNVAMINAYAKVPSTLILPYIGAGFGMVFGGDHTFTKNGIDYKYSIDSTTAYQAMLGATIDILAVPLKFDVEGRVLYAPDIYKVSGTNISPDMLQYNARIKVRYIF